MAYWVGNISLENMEFFIIGRFRVRHYTNDLIAIWSATTGVLILVIICLIVMND